MYREKTGTTLEIMSVSYPLERDFDSLGVSTIVALVVHGALLLSLIHI